MDVDGQTCVRHRIFSVLDKQQNRGNWKRVLRMLSRMLLASQCLEIMKIWKSNPTISKTFVQNVRGNCLTNFQWIQHSKIMMNVFRKWNTSTQKKLKQQFYMFSSFIVSYLQILHNF
ncbi:unnamed protein product [Hymenolepis diminuta]|uniref:Uncharacterized protein n=1 Tax=Hymenolepis diminuta TaxID=6216 RepID=A0A564YVZ8_HYMDI|nr:unnamed protein product [Hymenolepis diminuta]